MKNLPATRGAVDNERQRLSEWLYEWQLDQTLRAAEADQPVSAGEPAIAAPPAAWPTKTASVGDVILLPPILTRRPGERPVYVLVLEMTSDAFLAAPFSRFATPATDGEWWTKLRTKPLRVLCLWNTRTVPVRFLPRVWITARMPPDKQIPAFRIYKQIRQGDMRNASTASPDVGPPLRHPLDPRHAYLAEEADLLDEHLAVLESLLQEKPGALPYEHASAPHLLAAESRASYGQQDGHPRKKGQD